MAGPDAGGRLCARGSAPGDSCPVEEMGCSSSVPPGLLKHWLCGGEEFLVWLPPTRVGTANLLYLSVCKGPLPLGSFSERSNLKSGFTFREETCSQEHKQ